MFASLFYVGVAIAFGVVFGIIAGWGLSAILAFIGVKLVLHFGHLQDESIPEIETSTSLLVITVVLVITVAASLWKARRDPAARAHAGSLRNTRDERDRSTSGKT